MTTISAAQLKHITREFFSAQVPVHTADSCYAIMGAGFYFLVNKNAWWLLHRYGIYGRRPEFDCDNFAVNWKNVACLLFVTQARDYEGTGSVQPACGWFRFTRDRGTKHRAVCLLEENGFRCLEVMYEGMQELHLTETELGTVEKVEW